MANDPGMSKAADENAVRDRLERLIADKGIEYKYLSEQVLGKNHAYIQQFLKRGTPNKLGDDVRRKLGHYFKVDPGVFLPSYEQELVASDTPPPSVSRDIEAPGIIEIGSTPFAAIARYDAGLSAGPGCILDPHEQPLGYHVFEQQWLNALTRAAPQHLAILRVDGDSMEPSLHDGDWVLVDRTQRRFNREGIYAMQVGDAVWVKRLSLNLRDRLIRIISDNEMYETQELAEDEVSLVGRVIWIVGRKV